MKSLINKEFGIAATALASAMMLVAGGQGQDATSQRHGQQPAPVAVERTSAVSIPCLCENVGQSVDSVASQPTSSASRGMHAQFRIKDDTDRPRTLT